MFATWRYVTVEIEFAGSIIAAGTMPRQQFPVDDELARLPKLTRHRLQQIHDFIHQLAPGVEEVIRYGIPPFLVSGGLVHIAGFSRHIGLWPTPSGIQHLRSELAAKATALWRSSSLTQCDTAVTFVPEVGRLSV